MIEFIDTVLKQFKNIFSRTRSFNWFVITIIGLMLCNDGIGVTSIIRELCLNPKYYESLLHFFRSRAWNIEEVTKRWTSIVKENAPISNVNGMSILIGDGVKQAKEGKKMPGVKKLHQESENSSKAKYIFGHLFGVVSVLIGKAEKQFALPLTATIQDGVNVIRKYNDDKSVSQSHVVQVINQAGNIAKQLGSCIVLLDRYFLSVPALKKLSEFTNEAGQNILQIVTKAKITCRAYLDVPAYCGKGRPRLTGASIKVKDLFTTEIDKFLTAEIYMYGKIQEVQYYCVDLLWGRKLYKKLRFVLVMAKNYKPTILVSTSFELSAITIIELYSYRYKIEIGFKTLKSVVYGFCYHFWSKHMPKLNHYKKEKNEQAIELIADESSKKNIVSALNAIEGFVLCACIACGILQMLSLKFSCIAEVSKTRWLRTKTNNIVSEETVAYYLRKNFYRFIYKHRNLAIIQIIISKQHDHIDDFSKSA